jgi:hypothetical protein
MPYLQKIRWFLNTSGELQDEADQILQMIKNAILTLKQKDHQL